MNRSEPFARPRRLALFAILALSAILRLRGLGHQSLWYDEHLTRKSATVPFSGVIESVRTWENQPPGYFVLINPWAKVFGASEYSLRLPSALLGILAVYLIYLLGRELAGDRPEAVGVGLASALILGISRYHIAYSQEARTYSLLVTLGILSCWLWMRMLKRPGFGYQAAYVTTSAGLIWAHPYGGFILVAQNIVYALRLADRGAGVARHRVTPLRWIALQAAILLLYAPWIPILLYIAAAGQPWMPLYSISETLMAYGDTWVFLGVVGALGVIAVAVGFVRRDLNVLAALLFFLVPWLLPLLLSNHRHPMFAPRYGLCALIGLSILGGWGIALLGRRWSLPAVVAVLACAAPALLADFRSGMNWQIKPDSRSAAEDASRWAKPGDGLRQDACLEADVVRAYYHGPPLISVPLSLASEPSTDGLPTTQPALPAHVWMIALPSYADTDPDVGTRGTPYRVAAQHRYKGLVLIELTRER